MKSIYKAVDSYVSCLHLCVGLLIIIQLLAPPRMVYAELYFMNYKVTAKPKSNKIPFGNNFPQQK